MFSPESSQLIQLSYDKRRSRCWTGHRSANSNSPLNLTCMSFQCEEQWEHTNFTQKCSSWRFCVENKFINQEQKSEVQSWSDTSAVTIIYDTKNDPWGSALRTPQLCGWACTDTLSRWSNFWILLRVYKFLKHSVRRHRNLYKSRLTWRGDAGVWIWDSFTL